MDEISYHYYLLGYLSIRQVSDDTLTFILRNHRIQLKLWTETKRQKPK